MLLAHTWWVQASGSVTASWGAPVGLFFPRGTTPRQSPDPAVSETWAVLGLVGRDPGLGPCLQGLAWGLGAMLDGALLRG